MLGFRPFHAVNPFDTNSYHRSFGADTHPTYAWRIQCLCVSLFWRNYMKFKLSFVLLFVCGLAVIPANAQDKIGEGDVLKATSQKAVRFDISARLSEITPKLPEDQPPRGGREPKVIPLHGSKSVKDAAVQTQAISPLVAANVTASFDGVGVPNYTINSAPPDTTGAVGLTQYVQWVNTAFAVFDKSTKARIYGPAAGNTLWTGFGGPCETYNDGDPIVQYDKAANRWMLSQFAVSVTPYRQCVAVSTTSDATGSYARYEFTYGTSFNDYPKVGVWPDGYYVTYNMFANGSTFSGSRVCAFDRAKMLAGLPATQQCVQLSTAFGGLLPSDLDGSIQPPAGAPNYVVNYGTNRLNLWKFHVDWATPANTTFTGPTVITVASFTRACPSGSGACIQQPGTKQKLDSLSDRLMYRLAYRNYGTHESLVVNHSVQANSTRSGIRWYELRNLSATPTLYQQGTFAPNDGLYRWMGSIGMDKIGNMAVGYNVSNPTTIKPSIRFTGRAPGDPLGTMQSETNLLTGTGSQLRTLSRWGDYSHISIDPVDDCTFWFTTEYLQNNGTFNWSTRINTFKFPTCN